ncbi:hypothetical protein HK098_005757 [Nowakowskiella sp. JEL0407]|nr:hypothetical protein HK098_005757 [Nowakowskiella sp. JEL0407]
MSFPKIIYGTAWKKEKTADFVLQALQSGFRAIDTANQPKHYNETLVGVAIRSFLASSDVRREDLFIQTKFTSVNGQDPNTIPYDSRKSLEDQVEESLQLSLQHLGVEYLDSLVMHSPMRTHADTMRVWKKFEKFLTEGTVKMLGISNIYNLNALRHIWDDALIKPSIVQNRFYADTDYDIDIREFCRSNSIHYQSFWTLSANPHILSDPTFQRIAQKSNITAPQLMYRFVMDIDIVPLNGTTNAAHMTQDLNVLNMPSLEESDVEEIKLLLGIDS